MKEDCQHPATIVAPPPEVVPDSAPITAGGYLKLRREAARLSVEQAAAAATNARPGSDIRLVTALVHSAEEDRFALNETQLQQLRTAYPFDPFIYECLRDGVPAGRICARCGCSWNDACMDDHHQPCSWVSAASNLCTHCATPTLVPVAPLTLAERLVAYADQAQAAYDRVYAGIGCPAGTIRPAEVDLMREAAETIVRLETIVELEQRTAAIAEQLQ